MAKEKHVDALTVEELQLMMETYGKPETVCLIGSSRWHWAYEIVEYQLTLHYYKRVWTIGTTKSSDADLSLTNVQCIQLDALHFWKIRDADIIVAVNYGRYHGASTAREHEYATRLDKHIVYAEVDPRHQGNLNAQVLWYNSFWK